MSLFLPSINTSLIGCLTFILASSRAFLPSEIISLTKSIFSSSFKSIRLSSHLGNELKWTDSSFVKFWYISSLIYGEIGARSFDKPINTS